MNGKERLDILNSSNFRDVLRELSRLNSPTVDPSSTVTFDPTQQSHLGYHKELVSKLQETKVNEKLIKFAFCVDVDLESSPPVVYALLPDVQRTQAHIDFFRDVKYDQGSKEIVAFYPLDEGTFRQNVPAKNDIIRVIAAKNPQLAELNTPSDNIYLGVYKKNAFIKPSTDKAEVSTATQEIKINVTKIQQSLTEVPKTEIDQTKLFDLPFKGNFEITSLPRNRTPPKQGASSRHVALDIGLPVGTPVYAVTDFTIIPTKDNPAGFGTFVVGFNGEYYFYYGHLSKKEPPKKVKKGEIVGLSGNSGTSTAPHLHFEIRDKSGNKIDPTLLLGGKIVVKESEAKAVGLINRTITLPRSIDPRNNSYGFAPPEQIAKNLSVPTPNTNIPNSSTTGKVGSPVTNKPKMILVNFTTDTSPTQPQFSGGSSFIKVREDVSRDLEQVKKILNHFGIPLSCDFIDVKLSNNEISHFARVGLEIKLNKRCALNTDSDLSKNDYILVADRSRPVGLGYEFNVYARASQDIYDPNIPYEIERSVFDAYSIPASKRNQQIKTEKVYGTYVNITKIFNDYGFEFIKPNNQFFAASDPDKSNWNIIRKKICLDIGSTYEQLLLTVYDKTKDPVWSIAGVKWDGNRFI